MTRARAVRLALVNWKGLVYEEFELDEGVTALEGENWAGKTTVMIAAYTVLLPDLTYLRFGNVGEASGGGGEAGIWGRLGTQGPCYAWLDIRMPRQRVIAGVYLQRLSRPRLELEPLIIESAPEDIPLERLVMRASGGQLEVPDPQDLGSLALIQGARCVSYGRSKKEYFGRLFDLGITPVRMFTSDERSKVNEMLRTCMMGGISNTLRSGLRDFLFPENTRLADTVRRMEQNLDACRVTRSKVERNAALEKEIRELYRAKHLDRPDPRIRLAELRTAEADLKAQSDALTAQRTSRKARVAENERTLAALRNLLTHAHLLDPPDHAAEARALEARLSVAKGDARRLTELEPCFREIDTLRGDMMRPPLAAAEVEGLRAHLGQVHAERTGLVPVVQALDELARDPEPLGWAHFIPVLEQEEALGPTMKAELTAADASLERCRAEKKAAQETRDAAHQGASDAEVAWKMAQGHRDDTAQRLAETGIEAPSRDLLAEAQARLGQLRGQQKELSSSRSVLDEAKRRLDSELRGVRADLEGIEAKRSAGLRPQPNVIAPARAAPFLRWRDALPRIADAPPPPPPRPIGARAYGA